MFACSRFSRDQMAGLSQPPLAAPVASRLIRKPDEPNSPLEAGEQFYCAM
jgi:hypothetical protein